MSTKCTLNVNDIVNDLWDTMKENKKGSIDNEKAKTQSMVAGKIIKAKSDQLKAKKLTNKPEVLDFYLE